MSALRAPLSAPLLGAPQMLCAPPRPAGAAGAIVTPLDLVNFEICPPHWQLRCFFFYLVCHKNCLKYAYFAFGPGILKINKILGLVQIGQVILNFHLVKHKKV